MFVKEARVPGEEFDIHEDVDNFDIEIVDCTEGMDSKKDKGDEEEEEDHNHDDDDDDWEEGDEEEDDDDEDYEIDE